MGASKRNDGAARMSALRSMAYYCAEVEERRIQAHEAAEAAAARSLSAPPQLYQHMPGSQLSGEFGHVSAVAASAGVASAARHPLPWLAPSQQMEDPGAAAAAGGVSGADVVDSPCNPSVRGPPAPMRHESQTA